METKRTLQTNFPSVLSQYLPHQTTEESRENSGAKDEEEEKGTADQDHPEKSVTIKEADPPSKKSSIQHDRVRASVADIHKTQRERTDTSLGSMSAGRSARMKRQDAERFEHVAEVWDQARSEVLSERHSQLQEKVQLQHKLLKAQERQAEERRLRQEQRELQKRQEEKQQKQAKETALQDICKQSLDEDRKKAAADQRQQKANVVKKSLSPTAAPLTPQSDDTDNTTTSTSSSSNGVSVPRHLHRGYRPSMALPERHLSTSPMRELEDEDEDEAGHGVVPKHHAQLYELYGKQADYFLHPKPSETQPQRRPTHPKLKNPKGHIGAGDLWDTLRSDSMGKLIKNDLRFPPELKKYLRSTPKRTRRKKKESAFGAFVRERLTKHSKPVTRSFCATEDVPNIQRLMDQSKLRETRMYRHKTELMYRSSVTNMDRTSILLHNNPLPDITGGQADSISRYLPSWMDDQSDISEEEYMKWINARRERQQEGKENKENVRHSAHSRHMSETNNELQNIWHNLSTKQKQKTPRIQFLTEKASECEGEFSKKLQEEKDQKEKPQPHHMAKSYSALGFSHPSSAFSVNSSRERGRSIQSAMQLKRYRSDWEPLSMKALVEYKKQVYTEGEGEFEHGRTKMWPVKAASTTA
ncbi:uncharacterized protein [Littorina saxatilis]|uniref:uncharacterized protein isoform X2 n=1 Tax=Littorina saxatilis TaxID=31220 RepID=UPI0038B4A57B